MRAVNSSNATVFTNGSDAGVVKLATGVLHAQSVEAPIVGVASMACIKRYERMIKTGKKDPSSRVGRGGSVPYPSSLKNDQWGAQLNANHTHFIAVD